MMFMNVHRIVHDCFSPSVGVVNPVDIRICSVSAFPVSGIFMNNWAILFFLSPFAKCHKCRV